MTFRVVHLTWYPSPYSYTTRPSLFQNFLWPRDPNIVLAIDTEIKSKERPTVAIVVLNPTRVLGPSFAIRLGIVSDLLFAAQTGPTEFGRNGKIPNTE